MEYLGFLEIDTRFLTKIIRKFKSYNALISYNANGQFNINELTKQLKLHPSMDGLNLSSLVSTKNQYVYNEYPHNLIKPQNDGISSFNPNIVVIDFGVKTNILRHLVNLER